MAEGDGAASKRCWSCGEQIHTSAIKCRHCSSFQDWRRFVSFSQLTLSLVVALLTSLSLFLPILAETLKTETSQTDFRLIGGEKDGIRLFVSNRGWRPSLITEAFIDIRGIYPEFDTYQVRLDDSLQFSPIEAQTTVPLTLHPQSPRVEPTDRKLHEGCCDLALLVQEFDGTSRWHSFEYRCDYFIDFFVAWLGHKGGVAAAAPLQCEMDQSGG